MMPIATSVGVTPTTAVSVGVMPRMVAAVTGPQAQYQPPVYQGPVLAAPAALTRAPQRLGYGKDLQGVDLRLDQFDLSEPMTVSLESECGAFVKPLDDCASVSELFWASLSDSSQALQERDKHFLQDIFNPT